MKAKLLFPPFFEPPTAWLVSIGNIRLGVHLLDGWCIEVRGQARVLSRSDDMMHLLPLLEMGRVQFYEYLYRVAQGRSELKEIPSSFPAILLLRFALESSVSDYWPLKALDWIEAETTVDSKIREDLRTLLSKPWVSQRLKQRVERALKQC